MTIKAQVSRIVTDPYRPIMPSAGGGLMELPPIPGSNDFSNAADEEDERQLQDKKAKKEDGIDFKGRVNPGKQPNFTTNEKGCCQEKNEVFISTNVYNRLSESHDTRKNKSQKISSTNQPSVNQQQSVSLSMDKLNPKESIASCQGKNLEESLILENIAGNNGVQLRTEELLSGQFPVPTDGPNCPATACEDGIECQNMHYVRPTDSKYRTLDEIIAYAQNIAWSVKKLLTLKGNPNIGTSTDGHVDNAGCVHSSETSRKAYRYQSEVTYPKRPDIDDNHSRRISGPPTPIPIAYGEEADNMSMLDGEGLKDPRGRLECDSSTIAISDSRPPITRAKTKVKSMFSSSRTKSFRTKISRTRTDHELRNESVTSTLSCKLDNRKGSIVEQTRKSGRTQTFDSSNLHVRKDLQAPRSQLALMQDGTPVDPPSHEDKTHRFAISRSATSPGTPGFKALQRERSNQGMVGPFIRTNTKLTLRANKAAVLRKESINRSATLFHQQPAIDTSDTSPHLERKRGTSRQPAETMPKFKPLATITEKESPINAGLKEVSEYSTTPVSSNIRLEAQVIIEPPIQQQPRKADSEIYCGTTNYMNESDDSKDLVQYHEIHQGTTQQVKVYQEIPEKSPYCDELHHFGRGLENQLFTQAAEMEDQSNFALAPYFDITNGPKKQKEMPIMQNEEESSFYTDKQVVAQTSEHGLEKPDSIQWYSIRSVTSKSSTHIRDAIQVRSSLSEVGLARNSFIDNSVSHNKKHVKYSETDVDFGTIYHMARRTTPDQKVSSYSGFGASSNFFETGGDVSKSSSTISESSVAVADTDYTGGFFGDTLQESDKKDVRESQPSASEYTYFENVEKSKPDPIACDIYTGNVFNPIANSLALLGINDNCKNKSTNNSNRLPFYSYRSRSSFTRINKKHLLNCSNNSSSLVERTRSSSRENFGPKVTQTLSPSYVDHTGTLRAIAQPVSIPLSNVIDFTKYDDIDLGNSGPFFSSSSKYEDEKHPLYEGRKNGSIKNFASANQHVQKDSESLYTPGDRNTNINNNKGREEDLDINNNYFGDFYTGEMNNQWSSSQERRENHSSTPTKPPSPKYAPGSFYEHAYEHAYEEPQRSPPRAQPPTSSFFGAFTGYGEPQARQPQYSPDYADSFSYNAVNEVRSRSAGADSYEKYRRTTSASPRRNSYESDGYFDYHSPDPREERLMESHGRPRSPPVPKIKRVGAIICRENVANKDDYAEDVNRDLMEDSWIPISYRLAAEQVKEMGGGRCSSRELLKTTEAKCDSSMMDASPFAQSQILEAMGRKNAGWNLKQNTDSLKDDISMKWRDAGEQGSRTQLQQHQKKRRSSDVAPTRTSMSSVWRPSDHIPAKAMGPRTVVNKTESRGAKENKNNSNPNDPNATDEVASVQSGDPKMEMQSEASTASKQQKKFQKSRNSPETVRRPLFIPGTTKPARTVFAGKRARFPSKAVIEYPKLKLRRPSPCPSPPKPDITAKVVRGQDTLLISFCKNPEKCVVDPNDIDCGSSPFQRLQVITTTTDPDLDEQIQAEAAKSQIHTQPLSCFKPPKWVLLEDQQKPEIGPTEPSGGGGHVETKQPASEKRTHSADKEKSPAQKRKVQDDIGWEKLKSIEQDAKDAKGENIKTGNAEGKEPSGDSKAKARGGQGGDGLQESRKLQPDFERISHDIVLEAQINEHFQSDAPFANRGPFRKPMKEDDGKANELIQKYLSVQESQGEASGGEWPYINTSVHQEDLATYRVLSDQLQDAQRLMDMPVRKREKRLWKATGSK